MLAQVLRQLSSPVEGTFTRLVISIWEVFSQFSIVQVYLRFIMRCFHLPKPFSLSWIENLGNEIVNVSLMNFLETG